VSGVEPFLTSGGLIFRTPRPSDSEPGTNGNLDATRSTVPELLARWMRSSQTASARAGTDRQNGRMRSSISSHANLSASRGAANALPTSSGGVPSRPSLVSRSLGRAVTLAAHVNWSSRRFASAPTARIQLRFRRDLLTRGPTLAQMTNAGHRARLCGFRSQLSVYGLHRPLSQSFPVELCKSYKTAHSSPTHRLAWRSESQETGLNPLSIRL